MGEHFFPFATITSDADLGDEQFYAYVDYLEEQIPRITLADAIRLARQEVNHAFNDSWKSSTDPGRIGVVVTDDGITGAYAHGPRPPEVQFKISTANPAEMSRSDIRNASDALACLIIRSLGT